MNPQARAKVLAAPPSVAKRAVLSKIADIYRGNLFLLAQQLLGYPDITRPTHGRMIEALQAPTKRKLIVMPRGTFKSSVSVVAFCVFLLINDPNLRILIDSEKYENSKNFIREIKGKFTEPRMVELFGEFKKDSGWNEGEITIAQRTKVLKEASITASGIGAGKTGQHYDVIIMDDLNTAENSQNPEQRKKIVTHYQLNTSILEPEGVMVVVGTRYAVDDVIGHILNNEVNVKGLLA